MEKKSKSIYQVRIVVDANIVFSAILNTNSKLGNLLINSQKKFQFIAPDFLRIEIQKHHHRLVKISKLSLDEIRETEFLLYKHIAFISEEQIKPAIWQEAEKLVSNVDPKDVPYIAFCKHFKCKLWSGDKALMRGLKAKGFKQIVSTEELLLSRKKKF